MGTPLHRLSTSAETASYWMAKNLLGMSDKCEILLKKPSENNFLSGAPIIVKMDFEKYKYFSNFFHGLKYLVSDFETCTELVPTFYSHPACRLLEMQFILSSEEDCVQLVHK